MKTREIIKIVKGNRAVDGAGVNLVRVIGYRDTKELDPFLMLDAFDSYDPADYVKGFPWHPHRGIETVTYLINGRMDHEDSLGNKGSIMAGDCQWMTAGSGILHQEMPIASDRMLGAQLWINLPQKDKMTDPAYRDIKAEKIPLVKDENGEVRIISGSFKGTKGAMQADYVKATYLDINVFPNKSMTIPTIDIENVFAYLVDGDAEFGEKQTSISSHTGILFNKGEQIIIKAGKNGLRMLLLSGKALDEPIAWGGPIVMNTREELDHAFEELNNGTFIKHK
ncbi:MAG: pirin family protein [Dysgonamonadaceae bacterium]|nr:pirin family protein [Dysgonamonadaceae bacterium]MDD3309191.1 pirin family protein [Dysgonamonadaceae bacterium]MDD3899706.1 pirin family protein [Dysgonamonadaceae bacterium]MDD4398015.1 pirin family protein [Dysgonamonadaceae bacterium]